MTDAQKRAENLAPWLTGLLLAAPVLVAYYPPMTDLPYHEAAVGILSHFGDRAMFPPGLYVLNLGQPNQLFHMLGWPLAILFGSRWAVKLVVASAVLAIPVCAGRFARHVGASPLAALVVAPITLGWLFNWGLIANLLGLAAILAMLPVLDRFEDTPTVRGGAEVAGALVILYFAHEAMMLVFMSAAFLLAVLHPLAWKKTLIRLWPIALGVGIVETQYNWQKHLLSPAIKGVPLMWHSLGHKIERIPYIILPATEDAVQFAMLALCVAAVGSFFWLRARERRAEAASGAPGEVQAVPASRWQRLQRLGLRYRWELFALGSFTAYLVLPFTFNGATLVYQRWFPPTFATFVLLAAPRNLWVRSARITRLIAVLLPIGTLLVTWPSFADSGRSYKELEQLLPLIAEGSSVAELDLGPGDPTRTFSMGPSGGRVLATRGGRLDYAFTDSPASPVIIPKEYRWNQTLIRLGFDCWGFRPAFDFQSFRYALVRTSDAHVALLAQLAMAPEGRYVATAGEWVLFESTLAVIAPLSPPMHMPQPPPEQMRDRAARIVAQLSGAPEVAVPPEEEPDLSAPNGQRF